MLQFQGFINFYFKFISKLSKIFDKYFMFNYSDIIKVDIFFFLES